MSFWEDLGDNIVEGFEDSISAVGDFFTDPLGALEDIFNGTLDILTLGTFSYTKDAIRGFVAGLIPEQDYQDRQRTVRSASQPKTVIYGQVRTGGQLVYVEDQGKDNIVLWQCFVLAGHEVEEVVAVRANDEVVATSSGPGVNGVMVRPSNSFGNNIVCWSVHGNQSIAFIPQLNVSSTDPSYDGSFNPPNWTGDHRLSFQTYVWVALIFDKETFGDRGLPRITFDVKGKNDVYDPRTLTTGYTDNQALVMLDILRYDRMFDESDVNIDMDSFANAADIADEQVASGIGTTEKRYTANGTFKLQAVPLEILQSVATAGASLPYFEVSSGQWKVSPGAYESPVMSLDESDIIGGISFQAGPSKNSRHNVAKGTYIDPDQGFDPVGFEELRISQYISDDLEELEKSYDYAWTNSPTMARRLSKIDIERNRFGTQASLVLKFKAMELSIGDRISLTVESLGWNPKIFRIENVEVSFERGVAVKVREDAPEIYDWQEGDALALDPPPTLSIPDGLGISSPSNLTFSEQVIDGTGGFKRSQVSVDWPDQPSAEAYEIQYRLQGDSDWIEVSSYSTDSSASVRDLVDDTYDFRVRSISRLGVRSGWLQESYTLDGLTADSVDSVLLSELTNTPRDPDTIFSTVLVEVVPPSDPDFTHAVVEYRRQGTPDWFLTGPTDENNQVRQVIEADGRTYEFRCFSVSDVGIKSGTPVQDSIQLTNSNDFDRDDYWEHIEVPNVNGLELFEQANNSQFTGRDAKFIWRKTTVSEWKEFGNEGFGGAATGNLDQYFKDYQVEVWADNNLVRTEFVVDPIYVYSYEKNAEDYERINQQTGAWREFQLRVYCRSRVGSISHRAARLDVENAAPLALQNLSVVPGFNVIEISYSKPTDLDFAGVDIWVSTSQGFDPDITTPTATVSDNSYVASGLDQGTTYYVRLRPFDDFGKTQTNTSSEFVVTTKTGVDVTGLSGWAYEVDPVSRTFVQNNMEGGAIDLSDTVVGGQLAGPKLADLAVSAAKLANGSVDLSGAKITGQLAGVNLENAAVDTDKLADLSVQSAKLAGSSVTATKIANLAVGTAAIANAAITNAKIANLAVDTAQIANAAIESAKIANLAVGTAAIQNAAITNAKIENLAVTDAKIQDLTAAKITAGTIQATETITSEGLIRAVDDIGSPSVEAGLGPRDFSGTVYLQWAYNGSDLVFGVDELGNVSMTGSITASSFTNSALTIDASGNLTSTGNFKFGDLGGEYVDFDGTNLTIETPFVSISNTEAVFGDDTGENFVKFDGTDLTVGEDVKLFGGRVPHFGFVTSGGTIRNAPTGWSATRTAEGRYRITHNLGDSSQFNTVVLLSPFAIAGDFIVANVVNYFSNYVDVAMVSSSSQTYEDTPFNFSLIKTV